ncbi:MAG TPA: hypothetical protein PKE69_12910 [Pyrinomonadaceae bacterium]|nr:hypothetical protein [Pyrinomonadaceae bacterium]
MKHFVSEDNLHGSIDNSRYQSGFLVSAYLQPIYKKQTADNSQSKMELPAYSKILNFLTRIFALRDVAPKIQISVSS